VATSTVLCFANDEYGLAGERMIGVPDYDLKSQTPGIMDSPRKTMAASGNKGYS
jgi:hypothetical protein